MYKAGQLITIDKETYQVRLGLPCHDCAFQYEACTMYPCNICLDKELLPPDCILVWIPKPNSKRKPFPSIFKICGRIIRKLW